MVVDCSLPQNYLPLQKSKKKKSGMMSLWNDVIITAMLEFYTFRMKLQQRSQVQGEPADDAGPRLWSTDGEGKLATIAVI